MQVLAGISCIGPGPAGTVMPDGTRRHTDDDQMAVRSFVFVRDEQMIRIMLIDLAPEDGSTWSIIRASANVHAAARGDGRAAAFIGN